jgi:hypothetical protein
MNEEPSRKKKIDELDCLEEMEIMMMMTNDKYLWRSADAEILLRQLLHLHGCVGLCVVNERFGGKKAGKRFGGTWPHRKAWRFPPNFRHKFYWREHHCLLLAGASNSAENTCLHLFALTSNSTQLQPNHINTIGIIIYWKNKLFDNGGAAALCPPSGDIPCRCHEV